MALNSYKGKYMTDHYWGHKGSVRCCRLLPSHNLLATGESCCVPSHFTFPSFLTDVQLTCSSGAGTAHIHPSHLFIVHNSQQQRCNSSRCMMSVRFPVCHGC